MKNARPEKCNSKEETVKYELYRFVDGKAGYIWHLAPAYDLTLCTEGYNGQHATSVNSTGNPTLRDFITIGTKIKMNEKRCMEIFDEGYQNCDDLLLHDITKR